MLWKMIVSYIAFSEIILFIASTQYYKKNLNIVRIPGPFKACWDVNFVQTFNSNVAGFSIETNDSQSLMKQDNLDF